MRNLGIGPVISALQGAGFVKSLEIAGLPGFKVQKTSDSTGVVVSIYDGEGEGIKEVDHEQIGTIEQYAEVLVGAGNFAVNTKDPSRLVVTYAAPVEDEAAEGEPVAKTRGGRRSYMAGHKMTETAKANLKRISGTRAKLVSAALVIYAGLVADGVYGLPDGVDAETAMTILERYTPRQDGNTPAVANEDFEDDSEDAEDSDEA